MVKTKIKGVIYKHNNHIDIDISLDLMPFDIKLGEELYCCVKSFQKRGIHTDNKAHIFILKKDFISINKNIIEDENNKKYENLLRKNNELKKLLKLHEKKLTNQKKIINGLMKKIKR